MRRIATLEWDVAKLADSMGLTMDSLMEWSSDGRNLNKLAVARVKSELDFVGSPTAGGSELLVDSQKRRYVLRCFSRQGATFIRACMKGYGRNYDRDAWRGWLEGIDGFLVANISEFPSVDVFLVEVDELVDYFDGGDKLPELTFNEFDGFINKYLNKASAGTDENQDYWEEAS